MTMRFGILLAALTSYSASLHFSFSDGTPLAMHGKTYVWCGKWDDGTIVRTLRVQQGSPLGPPRWSLEIRLTLARRDRRIVLPTLSGRTAAMFVGDPRNELEASTDSERSRGSLTVVGDVNCRPGSTVRLSVDATLASEGAGGRSIRVRGTFLGAVAGTPAPGVQP